jgi:hypothetical protein
VSAPKVKPAPAGMSGKWNHARFIRACERVGVGSSAELAAIVNASKMTREAPPHHPNASATEIVRAYFAANPNAATRPRWVSPTMTPAQRVAVQQAMHRMAKAGELRRMSGGLYHSSTCKRPVVARECSAVRLTPRVARLLWDGELDPTHGAHGKQSAAFALAVALNVSLDWLVSEDPQ